MTDPLLHVVLYQPDIPQNTGNIGRTCVAVGARLWLIRPLGFEIDESRVRRAGLDYWQYLDYAIVDSWAEVRAAVPTGTVWCVENPAPRRLWSATFARGDLLLFGRETVGLPPHMKAEFSATTVDLPMRPMVRSLNLASTVNTAVYEVVRQLGGQIG
jgi:tRNA (cytidine/uridine-2'-O-)-methyltransferase